MRIKCVEGSLDPQDTGARLSEAEAYAILEPYFLAAKEVYAEYTLKLGLGKGIRRTRLECRAEMHDTERHFAGATTDGRLIAVAPEMAELPEDTVAAIFAHEFGHVVDHLHPGRFVLEESEESLIYVPECEYRVEDLRTAQVRVASMRQWEAREEDVIELTADLIAEQAIGHRIGYSGACMLQGFNRGKRRPKGLR